jgi:hypothetical protein
MFFSRRSDALAVRKKQIAALNSYFSGTIREVGCNCRRKKLLGRLNVFLFSPQITQDTLFEIVVASPGKMVIRISITLPEQFPYQPPIVQCLPPFSSPHLDPNGYLRPTAHEGGGREVFLTNGSEILSRFVALERAKQFGQSAVRGDCVRHCTCDSGCKRRFLSLCLFFGFS